MTKLVAASIAIAIVLAASVASARDAGASGDDDVAALVRQLNDEHAALQTQDCTTACRALASIRRAADRICALEPGPRCEDARTKAEDARRRVTEACPDCALAATPPKDEDRRASAKPAPAREAQVATAESAPGRGGCASCATTDTAPSGDLGVVVLGVWAASRLLRRKSSRRP